MRSINWLFERNVFDDGNPERMAKVVRSKGMPCAEIAFECVAGDEQELRPAGPVKFSDDQPVMVYGSMNLMKWLLRKGRWPKLAWYDFPRLRCQSYYARWGQFLLQRQYAFLPLAEINRRRDWLFQTFGRDGSVFVRPDDNAKSFGGGLVRQDQFDQWYALANFYEPGPDCLAVVSTPETIYAEWRLVIADRKAVTGSQYRRGGKEEISAGFPPEVGAFAETVANANHFNPHPIYVMDIAGTESGYRLVEIGSICCASLYACDLETVVDAVIKMAADSV
jgi:ATP-grasp domain, R2K clade family 3